MNDLTFYKRLSYGALIASLVAIGLLLFQPRVQTPLGPLGAVMFNGIYCNSGETNCVESRNGMNVILYSDDGTTTKFSVAGSSGNFASAGFQRQIASTAISVTNGSTITPTATYQPLTNGAAVTVSVVATTPFSAGQYLMLVNTSTNNIVVTNGDAAGTALAGAANLTLGTRDTVTFIFDGTRWVAVAASNN